MHQHRHAEAGPANGVGHGALVAKIGKRDQDAVNPAGVLLEQVGAFLRVLQGFDRAELGRGGRQRDHANAVLFKDRDHFLPSAVTKMRRKKAAIADEKSESHFSIHIVHFRFGLKCESIICSASLGVRNSDEH